MTQFPVSTSKIVGLLLVATVVAGMVAVLCGGTPVAARCAKRGPVSIVQFRQGPDHHAVSGCGAKRRKPATAAPWTTVRQAAPTATR